ncbi:MAG: M16 family metallopeptidase [Pirellulales bacterium]
MFREARLPNGLEIVAECNDDVHSSAVGFFVRTGARDETDEVAGVSHFLEHMMFKGTPTRSAADVNREFDELGAHYNAFTSEENTVYYAAVLPEYQDRAVALLGDILRPSLRPDDFDTEKQVILEEIKMYEDQPPYGADEKVKAAYFGNHPLGRSVLGSLESVGALSAEQMRAYFDSRYSPGNITLVATGRIDFDALVETAAKACGHWSMVPATRTIDPATPHPGFGCLEKQSAAQEYALQLAAAPAAADADRFAAKLLTVILGDDSGSRLYWELTDPGRAEHVSLSHYDYLGAGLFMTYLACDPQLVADNLARIERVYREIEASGPTELELEQAKRKINSRVVLGSEKPRSRLFSVGMNWVQRGEYRTVKEDLDAVARLTRDDLVAVLKSYPLTRNHTLAVGPLERLDNAG